MAKPFPAEWSTNGRHVAPSPGSDDSRAVAEVYDKSDLPIVTGAPRALRLLRKVVEAIKAGDGKHWPAVMEADYFLDDLKAAGIDVPLDPPPDPNTPHPAD